jgi:hypothetical protein
MAKINLEEVRKYLVEGGFVVMSTDRNLDFWKKQYPKARTLFSFSDKPLEERVETDWNLFNQALAQHGLTRDGFKGKRIVLAKVKDSQPKDNELTFV